jgi:hypothetical protein
MSRGLRVTQRAAFCVLAIPSDHDSVMVVPSTEGDSKFSRTGVIDDAVQFPAGLRGANIVRVYVNRRHYQLQLKVARHDRQNRCKSIFESGR